MKDDYTKINFSPEPFSWAMTIAQIANVDIDKLVSVLIEIDELLSQSRPGDANNLYGTVKEDVTALGFKVESKDLIEIIDAYECDEASEKLALIKDRLNKL